MGKRAKSGYDRAKSNIDFGKVAKKQNDLRNSKSLSKWAEPSDPKLHTKNFSDSNNTLMKNQSRRKVTISNHVSMTSHPPSVSVEFPTPAGKFSKKQMTLDLFGSAETSSPSDDTNATSSKNNRSSTGSSKDGQQHSEHIAKQDSLVKGRGSTASVNSTDSFKHKHHHHHSSTQKTSQNDSSGESTKIQHNNDGKRDSELSAGKPASPRENALTKIKKKAKEHYHYDGWKAEEEIDNIEKNFEVTNVYDHYKHMHRESDSGDIKDVNGGSGGSVNDADGVSKDNHFWGAALLPEK